MRLFYPFLVIFVKYFLPKEGLFMEKIATSTTSLFPANNADAVAPAPTLAQRVVKIQFHLQNMAQSAIIIGQELIECKKEVGHGNWANWLQKNFNLSQSSANKFMSVANRFGNSESIPNLGYTQLITLLALPAGEEEKFIAEKSAAGTPVEDMTVKTLRTEIKDWKAQAEKYKAESEAKDAEIENQVAQIS